MPLTPDQLTGATDSHLVSVDGHQLQPEAATAYNQMQAAARANGVELAIASGFRSLQRQQAIWNRKWSGERPLLSPTGESLDAHKLSDTDKLTAILHWSALPGASRHHWGTDCDVFDPRPFQQSDKKLQLVPAEYVDPNGPCHALWQWLTEHAHEYGFYFPYARYQGGVAQEPWHLSYRPLSTPCQQHLTLALLSETIQAMDILGKSVILDNLAHIKTQYIDNITEDDGWTTTWCGY